MSFKTDILKLYKHEKIDFIPKFHHFNFLPLDEIEHGHGLVKYGDTSIDIFGQSWIMTDLGATPTPNVYKAKDVEECLLLVPSDEAVDAQNWQEWVDRFTIGLHNDKKTEVFVADEWNEENLTEVFIPAGIFERLHHLIGVEDAMAALIEEPDTVKAFTKEMVRYKKAILRNVKKYANPDVVFCMDDFGTSQSMFMSRDMWLEFYFEPLKEIVSYTHELGMFYEQHSCGYITPIFGDIVATGADAINPVQDINDIDYIVQNFGGKILINGGVNGQLLASSFTEDEKLVQTIRTCVHKLAPTGCFLPEWMVQGATKERFQRVHEIYISELADIGIKCM